jgi:hypothetical protein
MFDAFLNLLIYLPFLPSQQNVGLKYGADEQITEQLFISRQLFAD